MNKLAVITQVTDRFKFVVTEESLKKCGLDYFVYGDSTWRGWYEKMQFTYDAANSLPEKYTHIMYVDSYDSVCLTGEEEIMSKYSKFGERIVFAAEKACSPDASKAMRYKHTTRSPWKFLNAGGYIGKRELFLKVLDDLKGQFKERIGDDQYVWTDRYLSQKYPIVLDTECELWQCMYLSCVAEFEAKDGRFINRSTKASPCVLHFNGKVDPEPFMSLLKSTIPAPIEKGSLREIAGKYGDQNWMIGTDKGTAHSYVSVYDELLSGYVGKGINFLEIGVASGKSLLMWQEFFVNAKVHGVDIAVKPEALLSHSEIEFRQASSCDSIAMNDFVKGTEFDVIIDDGSHKINDQLRTLEVLFPRLRVGGLYIVEDIDCFADCSKFRRYQNVEVKDMRGLKNKHDDVLVVIRKK